MIRKTTHRQKYGFPTRSGSRFPFSGIFLSVFCAAGDQPKYFSMICSGVSTSLSSFSDRIV